VNKKRESVVIYKIINKKSNRNCDSFVVSEIQKKWFSNVFSDKMSQVSNIVNIKMTRTYRIHSEHLCGNTGTPLIIYYYYYYKYFTLIISCRNSIYRASILCKILYKSSSVLFELFRNISVI
jgi:hypothetical protein